MWRKEEKMRDLLCESINLLIKNNLLDLNSLDDINWYIWHDMFWKKSKITWRWIKFWELEISVWVGIKEKIIDSDLGRPLNKKLGDWVELCCSWRLERKDWKYLQDSIFNIYCSKNAENYLYSLPNIKCNWFEKKWKTKY